MDRPTGSNAKKPKHAHIVWDEQNLQENEKIKAEFAGVKVVEPKTPYHRPLSEDGSECMRPFDLDADHPMPNGMTAFEYVLNRSERQAEAAANAQPANGSHAAQGSGAGSDACASDPGASAGGHGAGGSGSGASGSGAGGSSAGAGGSGSNVAAPGTSVAAVPADSWSDHECKVSANGSGYTSSDGEGGTSVQRRRRFEAARRQHYNMRDALVRAKELLKSDTEDEDQELDVEVEEAAMQLDGVDAEATPEADGEQARAV